MAGKCVEVRNEAFLVLYELGWNDKKIAEAFSLARNSVAYWREKMGLPSRNRANIIDEQGGREMHRGGASDPEIAKRYGVTQSGVVKWRKRRSLPANIPRPGIDDASERKIRKMLAQGASSSAIQRELGHSKPCILARRKGVKSPHLRQSGVSDKSLRLRANKRPDLIDRIRVAIGDRVPQTVRDHAVMDLFGDLYDGLLIEDAIESVAPSYRSRAYAMCGSAYEHSRLDADNNDGLRLIDTIADENWEAAFDLD